jgi:hypothetical protein
MERKTLKPSRRANKEVSVSTKFSPRLWEDCDARLAIIRGIRSRYHILKTAVGGDESPQRDLLAKRIAFLAILIESSEVSAAEGGHIDRGIYIQAVNALTGLLKAVGLERRVKNAGGLRSYLEQQDKG